MVDIPSRTVARKECGHRIGSFGDGTIQFYDIDIDAIINDQTEQNHEVQPAPEDQNQAEAEQPPAEPENVDNQQWVVQEGSAEQTEQAATEGENQAEQADQPPEQPEQPAEPQPDPVEPVERQPEQVEQQSEQTEQPAEQPPEEQHQQQEPENGDNQQWVLQEGAEQPAQSEQQGEEGNAPWAVPEGENPQQQEEQPEWTVNNEDGDKKEEEIDTQKYPPLKFLDENQPVENTEENHEGGAEDDLDALLNSLEAE